MAFSLSLSLFFDYYFFFGGGASKGWGLRNGGAPDDEKKWRPIKKMAPSSFFLFFVFDRPPISWQDGVVYRV